MFKLYQEKKSKNTWVPPPPFILLFIQFEHANCWHSAHPNYIRKKILGKQNLSSFWLRSNMPIAGNKIVTPGKVFYSIQRPLSAWGFSNMMIASKWPVWLWPRKKHVFSFLFSLFFEHSLSVPIASKWHIYLGQCFNFFFSDSWYH